MTDVCIDCPVCEGYELENGEDCGFCQGCGMFEISQDSLREFLDLGDEYEDFIENGGNPDEWIG